MREAESCDVKCLRPGDVVEIRESLVQGPVISVSDSERPGSMNSSDAVFSSAKEVIVACSSSKEFVDPGDWARDAGFCFRMVIDNSKFVGFLRCVVRPCGVPAVFEVPPRGKVPVLEHVSGGFELVKAP